MADPKPMSAEERAARSLFCRVGALASKNETQIAEILATHFRAAERAAVEGMVKLPEAWLDQQLLDSKFRNAFIKEAVAMELDALADAFGLPPRECPCRFHKSGHIDESHERTCQCKGTGTLPWDVESLVVKLASEVGR